MWEKAKWIWSDSENTVNDYARFHQEFAAKAGKAKVRVSADSEYALELNGAFVGCGQYADYEKYKVYDEYEVSLREGANALSILAYCKGTHFSTYRAGRPRLIFEVEQDGAAAYSSEETSAARDTGYKSGEIEKITGQLAFSFDYDSRFVPAAWGKAVCVDGPTALYPRPVAKLDILPPTAGEIAAIGAFCEKDETGTPAQRMQRAYMSYRLPERRSLPCQTGVAVEGDETGTYVLVDLFREEAGLFTMDIEVEKECEILIGWGEHTDDLRLRTHVGGRNFGARYMAKAGRQTFTHRMQRLGLRYVQLFVKAAKVKVYYAGVLPTPYPLGKMELSTSDRLHDRIAEVSARTLHLCMHEHYEDCPWREQALYAMDSRNQMLCGYYAFGEYAMPKASLRLLGLSLRGDGQLELCAPAGIPITIPSFTAMYVVELMEYVLFSGDLAFGREMLPVAETICGAFLTHLDENGVLPAYREAKYWNFYEWRPFLSEWRPCGRDGNTMNEETERREDAPLCAFVAISLRALADLREMLGEDGGDCRKAADELAKRTHDVFWDEEKGVYASYRDDTGLFHYAQLTQALMLLCGGVPEERRAALREKLAGDDTLTPVTTAYTVFKFDALMQDPAYADHVFGEVEKDWGKMLFSGATAFWETIDGARDFSDAGSLCHGWSAVPLYLYYRYALGLYPTRPGFAEYEIRPVDCGLYAPHAAVRTADRRVIRL